MSLLCNLGLHSWYEFNFNGESYRICGCGTIQKFVIMSWFTEGKVKDPKIIIDYYKRKKLLEDEKWSLRRKEREARILEAKDFLQMGDQKEEKA